VSEAYNLHFTWRINCQLQLWNNTGDVECRPLHRNGEFSRIIRQKYRDHASSGRKSANLTIDWLSQAALNTQMYPSNINCSRIDAFSIYTLTTYRQRSLPQNILLARTFTSRTATCSCFGNIYTTTSWAIVPWQSSLLASTNIGRQQSWLSTSVNYSRFNESLSSTTVVSTIFKDIIVTTNIIIATNIIAIVHVFVS